MTQDPFRRWLAVLLLAGWILGLLLLMIFAALDTTPDRFLSVMKDRKEMLPPRA